MSTLTPTSLIRRCSALLGLVLMVFVISGCGGGSGKEYKGSVKFNGKALPGGNIYLVPAEEAAQLAAGPIDPASGSIKIYQGTIDSEGNFSVLDVPEGKMKVAIETESIKMMASQQAQGGGGYGPDSSKMKGGNFQGLDGGGMMKYVPIPAKFANPNTSGLTWDLGSEETKTFELK